MAFSPQSKTARLPSGTTYCYLHLPAPNTANRLPTILFLHGFPSTAYDWHHQISHFSSMGYGILAPDLLGYGGTDQPLDFHAYKMSKMAREIIEILDHENVDKVIGVGHDWGSALLSELLRRNADRFLAFAFLATYYAPSNPYSSAGGNFDPKAMKKMSLEKFGFDAFSHTVFLGRSERAGRILDGHLESLFSIVFPKDPEIWKVHFRPEGAIERWVTEDRMGEMPDWMSETEKSRILELWKFGNGFAPKCNWYRQLLECISVDEESEEIEPRIQQPVLLMIETLDVPGRGDSAEEAARKVAVDVRVKKFETGHWIQLEDVNGTNATLEAFFKDLLTSTQTN